MSAPFKPVGEPLTLNDISVQIEKGGRRTRFRVRTASVVFLLDEDNLYDLADLLDEVCEHHETEKSLATK